MWQCPRQVLCKFDFKFQGEAIPVIAHAHPCTVIISPGSVRPVKCLSVFRMRLKLQSRRKYQKPDTHTTVSEAHFIVLFFSYQTKFFNKEEENKTYLRWDTDITHITTPLESLNAFLRCIFEVITEERKIVWQWWFIAYWNKWSFPLLMTGEWLEGGGGGGDSPEGWPQ